MVLSSNPNLRIQKLQNKTQKINGTNIFNLVILMAYKNRAVPKNTNIHLFGYLLFINQKITVARKTMAINKIGIETSTKVTYISKIN